MWQIQTVGQANWLGDEKKSMLMGNEKKGGLFLNKKRRHTYKMQCVWKNQLQRDVEIQGTSWMVTRFLMDRVPSEKYCDCLRWENAFLGRGLWSIQCRGPWHLPLALTGFSRKQHVQHGNICWIYVMVTRMFSYWAFQLFCMFNFVHN